MDYRKLNQETKFDAYPMPHIEELLDEIGKAKFITILDLAKGYWLVPLAKKKERRQLSLHRMDIPVFNNAFWTQWGASYFS